MVWRLQMCYNIIEQVKINKDVLEWKNNYIQFPWMMHLRRTTNAPSALLSKNLNRIYLILHLAPAPRTWRAISATSPTRRVSADTISSRCTSTAIPLETHGFWRHTSRKSTMNLQARWKSLNPQSFPLWTAWNVPGNSTIPWPHGHTKNSVPAISAVSMTTHMPDTLTLFSICTKKTQTSCKSWKTARGSALFILVTCVRAPWKN